MSPSNSLTSSSSLLLVVPFAAMIAVAPPLPQVGYGISTSGCNYLVPESDLDLKLRFQQLRAEWVAETVNTSSIDKIVLHPSYQRIIGIGRPALPLILEDLAREPNHWFSALAAISGDNPIAADDYGDFDRMAAAWLRWGKAKNYIS